MILTDEINVLENTIFYGDDPNRFYTIIPLFFQIFVMLFYFEIFELNFCNLNENTAKNIGKRIGTIYEANDINQRPSRPTEIELGDNYYLRNTTVTKFENNDNDDNLNSLINSVKDNNLLSVN